MKEKIKWLPEADSVARCPGCGIVEEVDPGDSIRITCECGLELEIECVAIFNIGVIERCEND